MLFVTTQPEMLTAAAGNLTGIGSAMAAQNAAAATPTTGVVPAAADEVSALIATQFAAHAANYQAVSAQAAAVHDMFWPRWAPAPVRMQPPSPRTRSQQADGG